jgi:uncharacterized SAM-binding protein YcdF (DUF218 family)
MARVDSPARPAAVRRHALATGALLGTLLWLAALALGLDEAAGVGARWRWGLLPVAALLGGALALHRVGRRLLWGTLAVVALALLAITRTPLMVGPTRALLRADSLPPVPLDAVVVLSARITADGYLSHEAVDRLLSGMAEVRRGTARRLYLSRVYFVREDRIVSGDADQRRVLALLGDDSLAVTVVDSVRSTHDEAVRMMARARPVGVRRIALVTSPAHSRRACAAFEKVGFEVVCRPSDSRDLSFRDLRETQDRAAAFRLWLYERLATALYRRRGWI